MYIYIYITLYVHTLMCTCMYVYDIYILLYVPVVLLCVAPILCLNLSGRRLDMDMVENGTYHQMAMIGHVIVESRK